MPVETKPPIASGLPEPAAPNVTEWLAPEPGPSAVKWPSPRCVELAHSKLATLSLAEKIGQMTQPDRGQLTGTGDVEKYLLGSVLSGGGSGPTRNEPAAWLEMVDGYAKSARATKSAIPLLYGIDAVHGHNNVQGATIFPHNIGLGCTRSPELVERVARATAEEVAATGIDWTFSPVLAAVRDERWGRTYEAFGETSELAELLGPAAIRGFQGPKLGGSPTGILACAKHFIGDGGTWLGKDRGNAIVDAQAALTLHLRQYQAAVDAGVGSVMVSYSSLNGTKMHAQRGLITDILKGKMGFAGFVVSDYAAIEQLPGNYTEQVKSAIGAGVDMVMGAKTFQGFQSTLAALVPKDIPMSRIDDAVSRILTVKCEMGLFDAPRARPPLSVIGSPEHRTLAREAVRRSLVLLVNRNDTLPISSNVSRLLVAGRNADDIGNQSGGWTIEWQGGSGPITTGTTILQGIRRAVGPTTQLTHVRDGHGPAGTEVAVVVIGERPYAEGNGDRSDLSLDPEDVAAVKNAKATGAKVVVVLISGRPMILGEVADLADGLIAAWLPGSEGAGVADVLFGSEKPTGKLGFSWPKQMADLPINIGDSHYEPLFAFGHGLTYP